MFLEFHRVDELEPQDGQLVVSINANGMFGLAQEVEVEWQLAELYTDYNEVVHRNGCFCTYQPDYDENDYEKIIVINGYEADPHTLWIDAQEYYAALEENYNG